MAWTDSAAVAEQGRAEIQAASEHIYRPYSLLLQTRDRSDNHELTGEVPRLCEEAGEALREWARITEQKLAAVSMSYSSNRNVIEIIEAQALWNFLDQVGMDISRYIEDPDSVLEGYEPLKRAAAPSALRLFWERYQKIFDKLGAYKDTLSIYLEVCKQQPISEVRRYQEDRRVDSRDIRDKMGEFMNVAVPLMQAVGKL
jgi:hypothetical protein